MNVCKNKKRQKKTAEKNVVYDTNEGTKRMDEN